MHFDIIIWYVLCVAGIVSALILLAQKHKEKKGKSFSNRVLSIFLIFYLGAIVGLVFDSLVKLGTSFFVVMFHDLYPNQGDIPMGIISLIIVFFMVWGVVYKPYSS